MSHTPGPWHTHELAIHTNHVTGTGVKHYEVATAVEHDGLSLDRTKRSVIALANANLIAAAPDLLDACKKLRAELMENISSICEGTCHHTECSVGRIADMAIAKAEGRS